MINCVKRLVSAALLLIMLVSLVPVTATAAQVFEGEDKVIVVIDPGHGGHDPGASKNGVTEEIWTLAVAKELKKILEENGNFIVHMTRTSDTYLTVSERGIIANEKNADLLFSIHFDSNGSAGVSGTTFITSIFDKYAAVGLGEKVLTELKNQVGLPKRKILRREDDAGYYWNAEKQWDCQDPSLGTLSDYYGIPTWGAKFGYKGVIVEHGFVSSKSDTDLIKKAGAKAIAAADAKAIIDYYTKHTHTYQSAPTMDYPSNCTFVGKQSVKCTTCGHRKNITNLEAAPDNHYWINEERQNATCGNDGYIYHECRITLNLIEKKVPGYKEHKETINLEAEEHEYEIVDSKKVTHAVDGYNKHECKKCGHTYTETIKCEGHTWFVSKDVKPTCTKAGKIVRACRGCDETKTETVKALGHSVKFSIEKEPTCTAVGIKAGICSRCDAKETEEIKALGHDMKYTVETEPTCTEEGLEKGACTRCKETEEKPLEALGHNMVEAKRVEPTCEESGYVESKCDRCDHAESTAIDTTGHLKGDDGVCTACGKVLETMPPETDAPAPQVVPADPISVENGSVDQGENKKGNELLAIILIAGAALLAVVFIVVRLIVAKKTTNNEDEAEADEEEEEETTPAEEVPEETEV